MEGKAAPLTSYLFKYRYTNRMPFAKSEHVQVIDRMERGI
jgi:hypothetical protein